MEHPFWKKVGPPSGPKGCRNYTGALNPKGYGYPRFEGRREGAHRVAWILSNGPIPDGLWVLHECDNPACCEPSHLFLGTPLQNTQDMIQKGRQPWDRDSDRPATFWEEKLRKQESVA